MDDSVRQYYSRLLGEMRTKRATWLRTWMDLNDYVRPRAMRLFVTDRDRGFPRHDRVVNNTPTLALRTLASGMLSGVTSPARPWFQLRTMDPDLNEHKAVKVWLETCRSRMADTFLKSNIYTSLYSTYSDLGQFGTHAFALMEDEQTVIRAYPFPIGSFFLANSERGLVDTCIRDYMMTRRQVVMKFGYENCSPGLQSCWDNKSGLEQWMEIIHAVSPNPDWDPNRSHSKFKRYRSVYFEMAEGGGKNGLLREAGFDEFPIMAPRWMVNGEDIYGQSPTMDCIGDIKALHLMEKREAQALEKVINPPMVGPSSLKRQRISLLPGDVTYVENPQAQQFVPAYEIKPDLPAIQRKMQIIEQRINEALFKSLFLMISDDTREQPATATEINERHEEKMLMLGPVLERLNDELLDPMIHRTWNIMRRRGMLPPPPPEMKDQSLAIEYVSVLAQAQKMLGVGAIEKFAAFTGNVAQAFPTCLDKVDGDEMVERYADMMGVPPQIINDDSQVKQVRALRQRQQQLQQQMAVAHQAAQTASTLGQTPVTDDNALGAMISRLTGGTPS